MKKNYLLIFLIFLLSCSQKQFESQINLESADTDQNSTSIINDHAIFKYEPLAWETQIKGSEEWSTTIYNVIRNEEPQMLGQNVADDIEIFCPKYRKLNEDQRLNFWGQLLVGISKYESGGWKLNTYFVETSFSKPDPVTNKQVASEGLLQLSYQDEIYNNIECGFNWNLDKNYKYDDLKKTIFNPHNNLRCGTKILAKQLLRERSLSTQTGVYWSVLQKNGKYTKVAEISALTKKLSFCK